MPRTTMAEKQTDEQRKERERREALILLFLMLMDDTQSHLTQTVTAYLTGQSSIHSTARTFTNTLYSAHTQATYYGRRLAGVTAPLGDPDAQFAQTIMQQQSPYITGLMNDLSTVRYPLTDDGELPGDLRARIQLYARRLRGTGNEAWTVSLPEDTLIYWHMSAIEDHCETCPERADGSPYRAGDLQWTPADGTSECGCNCLCYLETTAGEMAFPRS